MNLDPLIKILNNLAMGDGWLVKVFAEKARGSGFMPQESMLCAGRAWLPF